MGLFYLPCEMRFDMVSRYAGKATEYLSKVPIYDSYNGERHCP
jgi:hypothetical protein